MVRTSTFTRRFALASGLLAVVAGCSQQPKGPQLDPAGLPRAVHSLEKTVRTILEACEVGDNSGAHRPLHSVGKQISSVQLLLGAAGVSKENEDATEKSLQKLEDGLNGIDKKMHDSDEPEFDEQMIADLRETLSSLRTHMPASVVTELERLDEVAAERAAKAAEKKAEQAEQSEETSAADEPIESEDNADSAAADEATEEDADDEGPALP